MAKSFSRGTLLLLLIALIATAISSAQEVPTPRVILVSLQRGGGVGGMFAAMSRLCYAQGSGYHSVSYTEDDVVTWIPERDDVHLHPNHAGPCYGRSKANFDFIWGRLYALRRAMAEFKMTEHDWLVWMEPEAFITRPDIRLHDFLPLGDEERHLIVPSDAKLGVSTKVFALRGSKKGRDFLESWFDEQKATYDCARAEGAFMMAIMKKMHHDGAGEKCGNPRAEQKNPPKGREFWMKNFKTPLVECFAGLVKQDAAEAESCAASAIRPSTGAEQQHTTFPLKKGSVAVSSDCMLSDAAFATKQWDKDHTWIRFGTYEDHVRDAFDLGGRFQPRCF